MAIIDQISRDEPDFFSRQVRMARRFFRPKDPQETGGFLIVSGGVELCVPGYEVDRRDFGYWAIELVVSGRGTLELNGMNHDLRPGVLYAYGPGIHHRILANRNDLLEKYFVDMLHPESHDGLEGLLGRCLSDGVIHTHSPDSLRQTLDELIEYGRSGTSTGAEICAKSFDIFVLKIRETTIDRSISGSASYAAYRRCRALLEDRFLELMSVRELADHANVDVSYLCRLFGRFDTDSPYRVLTRLRMNHAASMLVREGISVSRVASELGYGDPFTFSRLFKNTIGLSPRHFAEYIRTGGTGSGVI